MLTVWVLAAPVLAMMVVGLPVRWALGRGKVLDESAWLQVPFVGIAFAVFVLQLHLLGNTPVNRGVLTLGGIVAVLAAIWLLRGGVRESLAHFPVAPFAVAGAVLLVQAVGLFRVGADAYFGRLWTDQCNYTTMAECARTLSYDVDYDTLGQRPWLVRVPALKTVRIGQYVLQGYHGVIARADTRFLFMPTILLGCPLLVLALYSTGRMLKLPTPWALLAGALGGLLPGMTSLCVECFLSHALAMPFFLGLPAVLASYHSRQDGTTWPVPALYVGALASIYPEFLPFIALLLTGFLVLALLGRPRLLHVLASLALFAAPALYNPHFNLIQYVRDLATYVGQPGVLAGLYPWAYHSASFVALWFGDPLLLDETSFRGLRGLARTWATAATVAGLGGLLWFGLGACRRWWAEGRCETRIRHALAPALLCLAVAPLALWAKDREHPYQFYKLLVTVGPLFVLGAVAMAALLAGAGERLSLRRLGAALTWTPALATFAAAAGGSVLTVWQCTQPSFRSYRSAHHAALDPDFQQLMQHLSGLKHQHIVYRPASGQWLTHQIWLMYAARHNDVWLTHPMHNDQIGVENNPATLHLTDLRRFPDDGLILCPRDSIFLQPPRNVRAQAVVWANATYLMWKPPGKQWACLTHLDNPHAAVERDGDVWLGSGPATLRLFAGTAGLAKLTARVLPGPDLEPGQKVRLLVKLGNGSQVVEMTGDRLVLPLIVDAGPSQVTLDVINPTQARPPGDKARLARLLIDAFDFEGGPTGTPWACLGPVVNANGVDEPVPHTCWMGEGVTTVPIWAARDGIAHLAVDLERGPCMDSAEMPRLRVNNGACTQTLAPTPGRHVLHVPVAKGWNAVQLRPLNERRVTLANDPRPLLMRLVLHRVDLLD